MWGRAWMWFVPIICFLMALFLLGAFFLRLIFGETAILKSTDAYQMAVAMAKTDPRVVAALGAPIKEGQFVSGNISVSASTTSGTSGKEDLTIPIYGPKGKATIYVVAAEAAGRWSFSKVAVQVDGTPNTIDLNEKRKRSERAAIGTRSISREMDYGWGAAS